MESPRRSNYAAIVALLLALILLAGLVALASPIFRLPVPVFIPVVVQEHRQVIAAGVIGLLFLIGYFVSHRLRDRLARRLESGEAEIQPETLAMAYHHKLMAQLSQLKVMDVAGPFDLKTSYIPLRVREKPRPCFEREGAAAVRQSSGQAELGAGAHRVLTAEGEVISPQEALARFRRLILLGEPGAGKTTLLRHLALQAATRPSFLPGVGETDEGDLAVFPIFVSLCHFATVASQTSLLNFVIRHIDALYSSPALHSYLEERLEEGSVLLLLDGLDETSIGCLRETDVAYRRVIGQINVLTARYPKVPIVITSRRAGWKGLLAADFHILDVLGLEEDDIQRFIEGWFGRGSDRAWKLRETILQNPQIQALAANPLLLSLMAFVFERDGELPEGRAGLYRRGMELLLEKWETHRGRKRVSRFTAEHQRGLLEEVALHFHLRRLLCFPEDDLSGVTSGYLSTVDLPANLVPIALERISAQYGLLREQAPRWYNFPHVTWQEYFAAAAINRRGQLELISESISDPWWEGTILFLAEMLEDATPLLEGILNQEDDIFCSNLLSAGRCLARKPRIKQPGLRESIIEQLQDLLEGKAHLPLRQQAIGVLAEIGDPSIAAYFMSLVTANKVDQIVHQWVTTALASLGDKSTVTDLVALLSDQEVDSAVRGNVAVALGFLGDKSVIPQFLALLSDEEVDYRVRMAVAEALGAFGAYPEPCPLGLSLGTKPEPGRRGSRRDESFIPQLLRLLPNEKIDYRVRVRVAEILGALGDESITSQLLRLLRNEKVDYNVRMTAAEALGSLGDKSISCRLLAILDKKKIDPDVRASIAAALGFLGDRSVIPQLLRLLTNERIDPSIRWRIVDSLSALGAMDDDAIAPELLALLANEKIDSSVRVSVAESMGERTVTPRLPTPIPIGRKAAEAIRSLGDRSKVPHLLALLSDRELDHSMRLTILEALGALGDDRITAEGLTALLDDEEIGSDVSRALFLVSQRIGARVFAKNGGGYEIR